MKVTSYKTHLQSGYVVCNKLSFVKVDNVFSRLVEGQFQVQLHSILNFKYNKIPNILTLLLMFLASPNISGATDYTDQPKHADRLDI